MNPPNTCCSRCGAAFEDPAAPFPRTCRACRGTTWSNPIPVVVGLVPVALEGREGLLVVRRGVEPGRGSLALAGGFLEAHEPWATGVAREVLEETGVRLDPGCFTPFGFASTERCTEVLLFCRSSEVLTGAALPPCPRTPETMGRGVVFGPRGLLEQFAFPLHARAAARHFAERGLVDAPAAFTAV